MVTTTDQHSISTSIGDVVGNVAIGNGNQQFNLQIGSIGSIEGGRLHVIAPDQIISPKSRALPVDLRPRRCRSFLGRVSETQRLKQYLDDGSWVELYAGDGWGKSSLMRHTAYADFDDAHDGVVYFSVSGKTSSEILQLLFDSFYECDIPYKPDEAELRKLLGPRRALILLDDIELDRENLQRILDTVRDSAVVIASPQPVLVGEAAMRLTGLPAPYARKLVEGRLNRKLNDAEVEQARRLHRIVEGHPLRLVQLAATVRELEMTLDELSGIQSVQEIDRFVSKGVRALGNRERKQVAALAALRGVRLKASQLAAITGVADNREMLRNLSDDGYLAEHPSDKKDEETRYSVRPNFLTFLKVTAASTVIMAAIKYGREWIVKYATNQDAIRREAEVLHSILESAAQIQDWQSVVEIGRVLEPILAISKNWDRCISTLETCLDAAAGLGDPQIHGWVMHELGTLSLCLGEHEVAVESLQEALRIREQIPNCPGIDATRGNLQLIHAAPIVEMSKRTPRPPEPQAPEPRLPEPSLPIPDPVSGYWWLMAYVGCGIAIGVLSLPFWWPLLNSLLNPPASISLQIDQREVIGGEEDIRVTARTTQAARAERMRIELMTNSDAAYFQQNGQRQRSVTTSIEPGQNAVSLVINTDVVDRPTDVVLELRRETDRKTIRQTVTLKPLAILDRLELIPNQISGGGTTQGRVWIQSAASQPITVRLTADSALTLPSSAIVPAHKQSVDFDVTVPASSGSRTYSIQAAFGDSQETATLTVAEAFEVPNLVGLSVREARIALTAAGLRLSAERSLRDNEQVISQLPPSHSAARPSFSEPGDAVSVIAAPVVPPVTGQPVREARRILAELGLRTADTRNAPDAAVVAAQQPPAGTVVDSGSVVNLQVKIRIPNVLNARVRDAFQELQDLNLDVQFHDDARRHLPSSRSVLSNARVLEQAPGAGELVDVGHSIKLNPGIEIPDLTNMTVEVARREIEHVGLQGNSTIERRAANASPNLRGMTLVISQQPAPGEVLPLGSTVNYVLARYTNDVRVPKLTGEQPSEAAHKLQALGLVPQDGGVRKVQTNDPGRRGRTLVVNQSPQPGETVEEGTQVTFRSAHYRAATITVPQLTGDSPDRAADTLRRSGLVPKDDGAGVTRTRDNRLVGQTLVVDQLPQAGEIVETGSTVAFRSTQYRIATITVPRLTGDSPDRAADTLRRSGLVPKDDGAGVTRTRDKRLVGQTVIVDQLPRPGIIVREGSTVAFRSTQYRIATVTVPRLTGLSPIVASERLQARGLNPRDRGVRRNEPTADRRLDGEVQVDGQSPLAGKVVEFGAPVDFWSARLVARVPVPNLRGMAAQTAYETLHARTLQGQTVATSERPTFNRQAAGTFVATQDPRPETLVRRGDTVRLQMIQRTFKVRVPNIVGQDVPSAHQILQRANLRSNGRQIKVPTPRVSVRRVDTLDDKDGVSNQLVAQPHNVQPTIYLAQRISPGSLPNNPRPTPAQQTVPLQRAMTTRVIKQQPAAGTAVDERAVVSFRYIVVPIQNPKGPRPPVLKPTTPRGRWPGIRTTPNSRPATPILHR